MLYATVPPKPEASPPAVVCCACISVIVNTNMIKEITLKEFLKKNSKKGGGGGGGGGSLSKVDQLKAIIANAEKLKTDIESLQLSIRVITDALNNSENLVTREAEYNAYRSSDITTAVNALLEAESSKTETDKNTDNVERKTLIETANKAKTALDDFTKTDFKAKQELFKQEQVIKEKTNENLNKFRKQIDAANNLIQYGTDFNKYLEEANENVNETPPDDIKLEKSIPELITAIGPVETAIQSAHSYYDNNNNVTQLLAAIGRSTNFDKSQQTNLIDSYLTAAKAANFDKI